MINDQNEFELTLDRIKETKKLLSKYEELYTGQEYIIHAGSIESILSQLVSELNDYLNLTNIDSELVISFSGKSSSAHTTSVNIVSDFLSELQGVLWASAETILGYSPRYRGGPSKDVSDNCTLILTHAQVGSYHIGVDYIKYGMFSNEELKLQGFQLFENAVDAVNRKDMEFFSSKFEDQYYLEKISEFSKVVDRNFDTANIVSRSAPDRIISFTPVTRMQASELLSDYITVEESSLEGRLCVLNFLSRRLELSYRDDRVSMYYNPDVISDEIVQKGANRRVRIHGKISRNRIGRIVDLDPKEIEILE